MPAASSAATATRSRAASTASASRSSTRSPSGSSPRCAATARSTARSSSAAIPTGDMEVVGKMETDDRPARRSFSFPTPRSSRSSTPTPATITQRLRETAFLTKGLHIKLADERADGKTVEFHYEDGIKDFVSYINEEKDRDPQAHGLLRGRDRARRGRGRDAVERLVPGVGLHVRQQHQHASRAARISPVSAAL